MKEFDDDPSVKIIVYEVSNESIYSNPTSYFNMSLPHIDLKLNYYQTVSFRDHI